MTSYRSMGFGNRYRPEATTFKVYARDCDHIEVCLYQDAKTYRHLTYEMTLKGDCVWEIEVPGDLKGKYYLYRLSRGVEVFSATDPFAVASSVDSRRSAIVDLEDAAVEGFNEDVYMSYRPQEAILYETHIRDMTMDPSLSLKHPGKYLGVAEVVADRPYGLSYLKELGITHLHLLPLQDFLSVKETDASAYNWGYDPEHYFVPEGSYASDPEDPLCRIREVRTMVQACHRAGLAVVLDVVYNHTYRGIENPLAILAPLIYYRHHRDGSFSNGSGCGNELNTEHPMVRQLIIDSLLHWMRVYHIDGFRFDLMALMDVETAKLVVDAIRGENPNAIIYGEPWTGGASTLDYSMQVVKGRQHSLGIALFNDDYRNALKGDSDGKDHGFVQGYKAKMHDIKTGLVGSIQYDHNHKGFCIEPWETINYLSAHDNLCLYDKLKYSTMWDDGAIKAATRLGLSLVLLSFGIPFIQAGSELMRTKQMDHNSYRSSDAINAIDWSLAKTHSDLVGYVRGLIALRKHLGCFEHFDAKTIKGRVKFIGGHGVLAYSIDLKSELGSRATVLFNPLHGDTEVTLQRSEHCRIIFSDMGFEPKGHLAPPPNQALRLKAFETLVLLTP